MYLIVFYIHIFYVLFTIHFRYTILQAVSAVVAFAVVLALSNDFLLLCWFTLVVWTGINMHLVDAMTEKSRVRLV